MMKRASWTRSESAVDEEVRGCKPDFDSSPEVLTWISMFRGELRSEGSALFSAVAAFSEVSVCME